MSKYLEVRWAKTHNLKNIDVKIPKNKMVIITGLSWSWKSSLAFNTIYNVWQQKYLESLSSYARMFIGWLKEEAKVDEIKWLSPTISIDQKTTNRNPRSTVWTITEIYDYYKLLYLNIGERKCVNCKTIVKKDSLKDIIQDINKLEQNTKFIIKSVYYKQEKWLTPEKIKKEILDLGFIRFTLWNNLYTVNDDFKLNEEKKYDIHIVIDRLISKDYSSEENTDLKRLKDSLELAFKIWNWQIEIETISETPHKKNYSNVFICSKCWTIPEELSISSFSFNSHAWACQECHWLWVKMVFLEEKVVNEELTIEEWAIIVPWFWWSYFSNLMKTISKKYKIRLDVPYKDLTKKEKDIIMNGTGDEIYKVNFLSEKWTSNTYNSKFEWVINTLTRRFFTSWTWTRENKWHYDKFITNIECPNCNWMRLKKQSLSVYFKNLNIWQLSNLSVSKAKTFFDNLELSENQKKITENIFKNIKERLEFLIWVWLWYITLARKANTLSGWESQRIRLATQIWVKLEWIIYVLDEPSIWLHPRDNNMLIDNLRKLKDIWNTLIIVEHDEDIMRKSDYIIDIWPWAWIHGWEVVAEWTVEEIIQNPKSITWPYLSKEKQVIIKKEKRKIDKYLEIIWAKQNNLKNIDVKIPVWNLTVVSWVSWSWKSSLINQILSKYLLNKLNRAKKQVWKVDKILWVENFDKALVIDQSPIWKTPRSNPATYTWVFTNIREIFTESYDAKLRWYSPWRFSFNTKDWRCGACEWEWTKKIEMHFLPPVYTKCEECDGKRFNRETLEIKYKWKNISDILNLTVEEAKDFFQNHPKVNKILKVLTKVWLWYIKLWQSSTTLSWWEAQRVKLATELSKRNTSKTVYILDEPTTWLHFQDVDKLLKVLHSLVDKWNTVIIIEHNMNVILNADYIIDIWPEGWDEWWELVAYGNIDNIKECKISYTGKAIKQYLEN